MTVSDVKKYLEWVWLQLTFSTSNVSKYQQDPMIWNMCSRSDVKNNEDINHINSVKLRPTPFWKLDENAKSNSSNFGCTFSWWTFSVLRIFYNSINQFEEYFWNIFTEFMAHLAEYYFIRLIIKKGRGKLMAL